MESLEKLTLNKHIATIHCSNNISLVQRKVYNVLLFNAYDRLLKDDFHYISLHELSKLIGYNSKDTAKLKKAFISLQSTIVEWNILAKGQQSTVAMQDNEIWCSSTLLASTVIDKKKSVCRYEYSKTLAELLYQPEVYARIDLNIQTRFRSSYALALYENCLRFKNINTTGWISVDTFRKLMGVAAEKYQKFNDFNRRILMPAIKEINNVSDIRVEVELQRKAQKVTSLKFYTSTITSKIKPIFSIKTKNKNQEILINKLMKEFNASAKEAKKIVNSYAEGYIRHKIEIIKTSEAYQQGKIRVPVALLKTALKENYQQMQNQSHQNLSLVKPKRLSLQEKEQYQQYVDMTLMEQFAALSPQEQESLEISFIEGCRYSNDPADLVLLSVYERSGLQSVKKDFVRYLQKSCPKLTTTVLSEEAFLKKVVKV